MACGKHYLHFVGACNYFIPVGCYTPGERLKTGTSINKYGNTLKDIRGRKGTEYAANV